MWETIRGYLTFTKKERYGVLFLLLLISALFVFPFFFKKPVGSPDPLVDKKYIEGIRHFEKSENDMPTNAVMDNRYILRRDAEGGRKKFISESFSSKMFYFDPNSTTAKSWKDLGLTDHLIQTIQHFTARGGRFRQPEDLAKLYGLHDADYQRLLPYVRIIKPPAAEHTGSDKQSNRFYNHSEKQIWENDSNHVLLTGAGHDKSVYTEKKLLPTDINTADSADWCKLPGIGARLASRIVHFREKLGGFYEIGQVGETFGLPDSSFQKIKSCLRINEIGLRQIDLNNASKEELVSHPYIRWQTAKSILDYRVQHGGFKSVDELQQLAQMDPEKFRKISPYCMVKP